MADSTTTSASPPAPAPAPRAAAKVLYLPELLENVLSFADPIQLFALRRVNSTFKDIIAQSSKIRMRMLLKPCTSCDRTEEVEDDEDGAEAIANLILDPRLVRVLAPFNVIPAGDLAYFDFELPCQWWYAQENRVEELSFAEESCSSMGSWRDIYIKPAADCVGYDATCYGNFMTLASTDCRRNVDWKAIETLGELVDSVMDAINKGVATKTHEAICGWDGVCL